MQAQVASTTMASHAHPQRTSLQAPEIAYRTHPRFPLGKRGPLEQVGGNAVLSTLRRLAIEKGVRAHTHFGCEVEAVHKDKADDKCAPQQSPRGLYYAHPCW